MSSSSLVAFIIGSGTNVGAGVAATLKENGYKVAVGNRNPTEATDGNYFPVQVDAANKESIFTAFDTVTKALGPVNVVIFNVMAFAYPPKANDILSLPVEDLSKATNIGVNAFAAAQAALPGFRDPIHKGHPKTFIVTGNVLPFLDVVPASYWALGVQKTIISRLIANASQAYEAEGFQFYFASMISTEGGLPNIAEEFRASGPTHGKVYWELINNEKQEDWDCRFTADGKRSTSKATPRYDIKFRIESPER